MLEAVVVPLLEARLRTVVARILVVRQGEAAERQDHARRQKYSFHIS
jgi:hypothetical protein